jgi:RNA polymerase sigma-70 factor (ECF subfamily)
MLLERHRDRLKRMVAVRADPRLAARVDPSDVVQESLTEAAEKLDRYLARPPLPFYPWLRRLALDRLATLFRHHVRTGRRAVTREEVRMGLSDQSAGELAERLFARQSDPAARLDRTEVQARVRSTLAALKDSEREVLVLRHLEGMPPKEIAAVLGVREGAVHTRHLRALRRLRELLEPGDTGEA